MRGRRRIAGFFLILAGITLAPAGWSQDGTPPPAGDGRLLPADYDVWSCDWSPDGRTAVFSGKIKGEDSTRIRVWLWSLPAAPVVWTDTDGMTDASPRWSPKGDGVVMVRRSLARIETENCLTSSIWWKAYPSGEGLRLTSGPEDREPAWSPEGDRLVFVRGQGPYVANLMIVDRNGRNLRPLTRGDGNLLASPCWAPDGWIYYTRYRLQKKEVKVGAGSFTGLEILRGSIERINPADGKIETVVQDEFDNRAPSVSRDGGMLAYISTRGVPAAPDHLYDRGALWVMDLKQRTTKLLSDKAGLNGAAPVWSPQNDKIFYFSFRSVRPAVWIAALTDNHPPIAPPSGSN